MFIREMHIEVEQSLQKVAANATRKFLKEEVDWVLNKMMHRFIQSKVKIADSGKVTQLDTDALRSLVVSGKEIPAIVDNSSRLRFPLPSNYMHLLSDASIVLKKCVEEVGTETVSDSFVLVPVSKSTLGSPPYYADVSLTTDGYTYVLPADLSTLAEYVGFNSVNSVYEVVAYILGKARKYDDAEVYWQFYDDMNAANSFVIKGSTGILTVDGTTVVGSSSQHNYTRFKTPVQSGSYVDNRLSSTHEISNLRATAFYQTNALSPISELVGNTLYVYRDDSFIVTKVQVNYIRKPKRMSLDLGIDCEIAEEYHQTICDLAVEYLKGRLGDAPGKQLMEQDIQTRVSL